MLGAAALQSLNQFARKLLDGTDGAWINVATDRTRFQDAAGTTLATADGNPIGLVYDTKNGVPALETSISLLTTTAQKTADGTTTVNILATDSYAYECVSVSFSVASVTGSFTVSSTGTNGTSVTIDSTGSKTIIVALGAIGGYLKFEGATTSRFDVSGIVVKGLAGNHALQQTTTARPTYRINPKRGDLDSVDDALRVHISTPIVGSFAFACADGILQGELTIPAGVFQFPSVPSYSQFYSVCQLFFSDRVLTASEKSKLYNMLCAAGSYGDFRTRTLMGNMLRGSAYLTSVDVSNWDTSGVTSFNSFARDCTSLTALDVSGWDTSSVTSFGSFARGCTSLTALDVSGCDTSSVTSFGSFAYNCPSLTTLDVSGWDTSGVTDFSAFAYNCTSLTALDVSGWDTSSVTSFEAFIQECTSLTTLDVSGWDTSSVTSFSYFAFNCTALSSISVGSAFSSSPCTKYNNAFYNCALNTASVDAILANINAAGTSGGTLGLQGSNNAIPTGGAANANVVALRARGWTINNSKGW